MARKKHKYTIAVDFDGVLHSYTTKWIAPEVIPDPPIDGSINWLNSMFGQFNVYIHTTRAGTDEGRVAIARWLVMNGLEPRYYEDLTITNEKLPAHLYIDDRGYYFTGANYPTAEWINEFQRHGHEQ